MEFECGSKVGLEDGKSRVGVDAPWTNISSALIVQTRNARPRASFRAPFCGRATPYVQKSGVCKDTHP